MTASSQNTYHSSGETAIAFGDPRETALYYHNVIPFDTQAFRQSCQSCKEGERHKVLESILPPGKKDRINLYYLYSMTATHIIGGPLPPFKEGEYASEIRTQLQRQQEQRTSLEQFWDLRGGLLLKEAEAVLRAERDTFPTRPRPASFNSTALAVAFTRLVRDELGISPTVIGGTPRKSVETDEDDYCFDFTGLKLVDIQSISWDHLVKFRQDSATWEQLRSLTTFVHANYEGKSKAFVYDDLSRRVNEYERVVKAWGFETRDAILNLAFSKKTAIPAFAAVTAALSGEPIAAVIAAGGGILWAARDIVLTVRKRRRDFALASDASRVRFLVEARRLTKP